MGTLATSAYFLTCCRPSLNPSFCYYIEVPKFINVNNYQGDFETNQQIKCSTHNKLEDHLLNPYNTCTDLRSWCLDDEQRRKHFVEIASQRTRHCGFTNSENLNENVKEENPTQSSPVVVSEESHVDKKVFVPKEQENKDAAKKKQEKEDIAKKILDVDLTPVKEKPEKPLVPSAHSLPTKQADEDAVVLTDEIFNKLNCNLATLEGTFDKFLRKNRDFIQHLSECLKYEKQRQIQLENSYCKLKQENDVLRTSNDYLKMVNGKQLDLFRKELDKAIFENKTGFRKKIQQMDCIIQNHKEELQYYKQNECKILQAFDNEKREVDRLKNEICNLKNKDTKLLKNYVKVLNFLEDVKKTLSANSGDCGGHQLQRSSHTTTDSGMQPNVNEVLRNALYNGIECLNVRDLSVLHDAIQEINERLCHQNDFCGKSPSTNLTISHLSMFYTEQLEEYPQTDYSFKRMKDYGTPSNLSIFPSRQRPDKSKMCSC